MVPINPPLSYILNPKSTKVHVPFVGTLDSTYNVDSWIRKIRRLTLQGPHIFSLTWLTMMNERIDISNF